MNRRDVLGALATGSLLSVAGCLSMAAPSDTHSDDHNNTVAIPQNVSEYPVSRSNDNFDGIQTELLGVLEEETYKQIDVGDRENRPDEVRSHSVIIWNVIEPADILTAEPPMNVTLTDIQAEKRVHNEMHKIPDGETLILSVHEPSQYLVTVELPEFGTAQTLRIPCRMFNCNASSTRLAVVEDGQFTSTVFSTLQGCPDFEPPC